MEQPPFGYTLPINLVRIKDGDTIRASITIEFDVRIIKRDGEFDTAEIFRPKNEQERKEGEAALQALKRLIFHDYDVVTTDNAGEFLEKPRKLAIFIPSDGVGYIGDILTINRVAAVLFADGVDVAEELDRLGFNKKADVDTK